VGKLADFGIVSFTSEIVMTTKGSKIKKAQPTALTAGGSAFSVTWLHN
jgi:hypothetical protein